jgi:anaerobic ribonucleoside-triphosphate reductase
MNQKAPIKKVVPVEVYSRVVGYFRPVSQWHSGKKAEFFNRVPYKIDHKKI